MSSTPFGEHLKREREMRGVSLEEISAATRISTRFLEAIEKDQWEQLPGGVFNRGFIRSIARFLGLDEDSLVAEYALGTTGSTDVRVAAHQPVEMPRNWRPVIAAIVVSALVMVGAFVGYRRYGAEIEARLHGRSSRVNAADIPQGTDMPSGSSSPSAGAPAADGQAVPVAADNLVLKMEASKPANVKVTADGTVLFDGPVQANDEKQFDAHDTFEISSTDSSAVTLELDGQTVPPIGAAGKPGSVTLTRDNLKSPQGDPISAELRSQIRSGHARPEQKLAICAGSVPLSPEDRVELLAVLAADSDSALSERAQNALLTQPPEHFLAAVARADADPHLFTYCADNLSEKRGIADALAKNAVCPTAQVARVAPYLTVTGIQSLFENLERFASDPDLAIAVSASSAATAEQKALLGEMQKGPVALNTKEIEEVAAVIEPDPVRRESLMQKVSRMNVVQRLTLALKGGRSERMLLIHDSNKLVQRCVLQSPRLTETEVEAFASMTNLTGEILRAISLTRVFMKNYSIVKNLINNPKTPLDVSLHLFPRLNATDLVKLTANKNVPETLRSSAQKLHRKRKMGVPGD